MLIICTHAPCVCAREILGDHGYCWMGGGTRRLHHTRWVVSSARGDGVEVEAPVNFSQLLFSLELESEASEREEREAGLPADS